MLFDKSQLMRGTLEGCILKIINEKATYGYEIFLSLKKQGFCEISEGTVYPLLLRLEKQGSIISKILPSPRGPKRKYYSVTEKGRKYLTSFIAYWQKITDVAGLILFDGDRIEKT